MEGGGEEAAEADGVARMSSMEEDTDSGERGCGWGWAEKEEESAEEGAEGEGDRVREGRGVYAVEGLELRRMPPLGLRWMVLMLWDGGWRT